jgi:hypothetical protein
VDEERDRARARLDIADAARRGLDVATLCLGDRDVVRVARWHDPDGEW